MKQYYTNIVASDMETLNLRVMQWMRDGWTPLGGMNSIVRGHQGSAYFGEYRNTVSYIQTMVCNEDKIDKELAEHLDFRVDNLDSNQIS